MLISCDRCLDLPCRQLGIRTLHSAAIVKRHNANVVETEDGLTITFSGSINKLRTVLNGFSPEVLFFYIVLVLFSLTLSA